jgi:ABC-type Zn uptake system ZnuABC Zn-binding protein ZnuA
MLTIAMNFVLANDKLKVVTTLTTYADIARQIGGDYVEVKYIVSGDQDAHFVRPRPSYAVLLNKADLFITTGLDLELWAPTLVDMSKNNKIRSGQSGYVAAYQGIELLERPAMLSRSEGDIHLYGNPHITNSPLAMKIIAANIASGLIKNKSAQKDYFYQNLEKLKNKIDERLFGVDLVKILGGQLLTKLAVSAKLIPFLEEKTFQGKPMISYLGGWLKQGMSFRGKKIVAYHKNWSYFEQIFGVQIIGFVEPKPGIPPSPKHIEQLTADMRENGVKVVLAANYFDENKVRNICQRVNAQAVIVPMYVDGAPGTDSIYRLIDLWMNSLAGAFVQE